MRLQIFTAPKNPEAPDEYEDAVQATDTRVAVADGATSSSFSGIWAELLARAYVAGDLDDDLLAGVACCACAWRAAASTRPLPWFAAEKARRGAHAALIGWRLHDEGWEALAVGDCCLFQVRDEALYAAFPATRADDLHSRPMLLSTEAADNAALGPWVRHERGDWRPGDHFFLMSDALAAWFLEEAAERQRAPWRWLVGLGTHQQVRSFSQLVRDLRQAGRLRVDDVTLALITL